MIGRKHPLVEVPGGGHFIWACATLAIPTTASVLSAKAAMSDFSIFVSPEF